VNCCREVLFFQKRKYFFCFFFENCLKNYFYRALKRLTIYLAYTYPRVRVVTSQKIYEALLTYGAEYVEPEKLERVMTLLSETQWDEDVNKVRLVRNQICEEFGLPLPFLK
jgi:hypothetical protein